MTDDDQAQVPGRLHHRTLLVMAGVIASFMVGLLALANQRIDQVGGEQSRALAEWVARTSASLLEQPLAQGDAGAAQLVLHDLSSLPGVVHIETQPAAVTGAKPSMRDAQSQPVASAKRREDAMSSMAWAPIGPDEAQGRVLVQVSPEAVYGPLERLRLQVLVVAVLTGILLLAGAHLLLSRTVNPLRRLTCFARRLAAMPGEQLPAGCGGHVVQALTEALNDASRQLRQQFDALRASESRLTGMVAAAPDAIIGFDTDGRITIASPAVASIFGHDSARLAGMDVSEFLPDLSAQIAEERTLNGQFRRSSGSHVVQWETEALRNGGTRFPVELSLARTETEQGVRYAAVLRDITERRMADELLHLYGRALGCASSGIVISDISLPGQPVFYANPAFETITGYTPDDTIGRNCAFLQRDDQAQPELRILGDAVRQRQAAKVVLRNYRKDGSLFFNELSIAPVAAADGTIRHFVGVIDDVTERERTRLAIAERNARLNAIFDLSPDGFVVFDREGQLVYTNRVFLRLTGWEDGVALQGMTLAEFDQRLRDLHDPAHVYPPLSMQGSDDGGFETTDLMHLQHPRARVLSRLVRHNAGGQGESILYFRDITHETEVDRMKSEFLTTAAHELRTPMVSVFGFTELLLSRPVPEAKRRDVLETIHRQASVLINMVNELLDLARIESGHGGRLALAVCPVAASLSDAARGLGSSASERHPVRVEPVDPACRVLADTDKLARVLGNVISNAAKYSPEGGEIRLGCKAGDIDGKPAWGLWVKDQGIGMSEAQLERIFERFYRADPSGNIPGTGLGMSLVKEIVDQHHGRVQVESQPGEGTLVTLWLPAAAELVSEEALLALPAA
jgi:PAS domain S-box-containing protein